MQYLLTIGTAIGKNTVVCIGFLIIAHIIVIEKEFWLQLFSRGTRICVDLVAPSTGQQLLLSVQDDCPTIEGAKSHD